MQNKKPASKADMNQIIERLNQDVVDLIGKFQQDLDRAREIQKSLIPEKFPEVHGLQVIHKYLSGLKSGGDYLDFFEFEDKTHVGILLSDSTGYGLSSSFLSLMLRLAMKLSKDEARSPSLTMSKIFEDLRVTMKPKEDFSFFYGIFNRKTFELTYCNAGSVFAYIQNSKIKELHSTAMPALKGDGAVKFEDQKIYVNPGERIVILSDGFHGVFTKEDTLLERLEQTHDKDSIEFLNECVYRVKSRYETEDDMPEQDCSMFVIDVEKRAMRLAK